MDDTRASATSTAPRFLRTADLRRAGMSRAQVVQTVAVGRLRRLRRGVYTTSDVALDCCSAVGAHGRLACVSELRRRGVFVQERSDLHIHIDETTSRFPVLHQGWRVHRRVLARRPHPRSMSVEVFDALLDAVVCQGPRAAVATLDSALHLGVLRDDELDELFATLPRRYRRLRRLLDARAKSGPESLVRLILRALGVRFEVQVEIATIGRVDFLVDGWLIVECDSRAFHSDWKAQLEDRRRDLAAARQGFVTLRLAAEDIMWHREAVTAALRGILTAPRRVPNTGRMGPNRVGPGRPR